MPTRTIGETMEALGQELLEELDGIARSSHARYRDYRPEDLIEHDVRAQAACTYAHMLAEADRRFVDRTGVQSFDIRGQKLWLFEEPNVIIRLKKMDEDGRSRNYPTKQARAFDAQDDLPGLPSPAVRLTAGYLLDATGTNFVRSQVARPDGKNALWCAAIVPHEEREEEGRVWVEVTRQRRFG
ncbi:MAG: hypothetical protein H6886_01385 [Hyphomicrobiaceae bacterium]|nr:hypothetical protein [Hyphomicrobiaceae bacterium]